MRLLIVCIMLAFVAGCTKPQFAGCESPANCPQGNPFCNCDNCKCGNECGRWCSIIPAGATSNLPPCPAGKCEGECRCADSKDCEKGTCPPKLPPLPSQQAWADAWRAVNSGREVIVSVGVPGGDFHVDAMNNEPPGLYRCWLYRESNGATRAAWEKGHYAKVQTQTCAPGGCRIIESQVWVKD